MRVRRYFKLNLIRLAAARGRGPYPKPTHFVPDGFVSSCGGGGMGAGVPDPDDNVFGDPAPETGVMVKFDGANWRDR